MKINKVLSEVFSARSNMEVLRVLENYINGISGREVARLSGLSPKTTISSLTLLESLGVINIIRGGREHIFSFNRKNYIVNEIILPMLKREADFKDAIFNDIKKHLKKQSHSVYLFGSVARNEESIESDLDLCIIYEDKKDKEQIEEAFYELSNLLYEKYRVTAAPIYFTKAEFVKRAKQKKSPLPSIIEDGKLIFGTPLQRILIDSKK